MIHVLGVHVEGRVVLTPWLQDRIGRNGGVEYPLGDANSFDIRICRAGVVCTAHPPGAKTTVGVQDITIDLKACQVFLGNRP